MFLIFFKIYTLHNNNIIWLLVIYSYHWISVMWIRIYCIWIRIHKVWSIRIRIQFGSRSIKSPNFQNIFSFLKVKWYTYFLKHQHLPFFRFRLKKYYFLRNFFWWLNWAFPLILSVILYLWIRIRIRIHITAEFKVQKSFQRHILFPNVCIITY